MQSVSLDLEKHDDIRTFAESVIARFPKLNVLINNAGIMRPEHLNAERVDVAVAESIVITNLLGPIRLTAALLPHFKKQPRATIMNVSSGLAFVPFTLTPTYCATKAALHSYTQSLRYQLKSTKVEVLELIPPYVATDLMGGAKDPRAMPLNEFHFRDNGDPEEPAYAGGDLCGAREGNSLCGRKRTLRWRVSGPEFGVSRL
jgi:uncharacterized oxidoreductase